MVFASNHEDPPTSWPRDSCGINIASNHTMKVLRHDVRTTTNPTWSSSCGVAQYTYTVRGCEHTAQPRIMMMIQRGIRSVRMNMKCIESSRGSYSLCTGRISPLGSSSTVGIDGSLPSIPTMELGPLVTSFVPDTAPAAEGTVSAEAQPRYAPTLAGVLSRDAPTPEDVLSRHAIATDTYATDAISVVGACVWIG